MSSVLLLFISCEKKQITIDDLQCTVTARNGEKDNINSRWKLVTVEHVFVEPRIDDYSCNNIIYGFKSDGNLVITSDLQEPPGFSAGTYEFKLTSKSYYHLAGSRTLQIGHSEWACWISKSQMTLDSSPLDGPILTFYRVQ